MHICNRRNEERKRKVVDKRKQGEGRAEYHHKRKEAHKIIRNKKKTYVKNVESIEDQKHNSTRKLYETVNQFKKGYQHKFSIIRNKKGELAINTREKEIWKEYFDKLLNTEEPRELNKKGNKEISKAKVDVEEIIIEDVREKIKNIKCNKVAGTDGINLELIKYGENTLLNRLFEPVR